MGLEKMNGWKPRYKCKHWLLCDKPRFKVLGSVSGARYDRQDLS